MYILLIMALLAVMRTNIAHRRTIKRLNAQALSNTQLAIQNKELISSNNYLQNCKANLNIENKRLVDQNLSIGFKNLDLIDKIERIQNQNFRFYKPTQIQIDKLISHN